MECSMKKYLYIYGILIFVFVVFNFYFSLNDERLNTAINLLLGGVIFGYIAWVAFIILKKMKK